MRKTIVVRSVSWLCTHVDAGSLTMMSESTGMGIFSATPPTRAYSGERMSDDAHGPSVPTSVVFIVKTVEPYLYVPATRGRKMHIRPSSDWMTHMAVMRPRRPHFLATASERMPPHERAKRFISEKHAASGPAVVGFMA